MGDEAGFIGSYDITVDGKGRVALPARLRDDLVQFDPDRRVVLVASRDRPFCSVHPRSRFLRRLNHLSAKLDEVADDSALMDEIRELTEDAHQAQFDDQWRIVLPPEIRDGIRSADKLRVVGAASRIELWVPEAHEHAKAERRRLREQARQNSAAVER